MASSDHAPEDLPRPTLGTSKSSSGGGGGGGHRAAEKGKGRYTRAAIVASMREEEVAAERHGSGAGAGSNAVGDLVDLLGGDSFVVEDPPRPGKDKKGVEGHTGGVVDPFDVSVSVGNGVGGGAGGGARRVDPLDELLAPAPAMGQSAYDPFAR